MFGLFKREVAPSDGDLMTAFYVEIDGIETEYEARDRRLRPDHYAKLDAATAFLDERLGRVARAHAADLMKADLAGYNGAATLQRLKSVTKTMGAGVISACDAMYGQSITDSALTLAGRARSEFY